MWFEDVMLLVLIAVGIFFVGIPVAKLVKQLIPQKRNPVKDAQEKLDQARLELEAAKINKQVEEVYSDLYEEVIADNNDNKERKQL